MNDHPRVSMMKRYFEGEALIAGWGMVAKGIGFINTVITLSALSIYQYGVFQLLLTSYGFFSGLTGIGVSFAGIDVSRAIGARNEARAKRLFLELHGVRFICSIAAGLIFYFATDLILIYNPVFDVRFLDYFHILAFMFISDELISFAQKLMAYRLDFGTFARRSSIQKVLQCVVLLYFLLFESIGIREVLLSIVISSYLSVLFLVSGMLSAYAPWRYVRAERGPIFWRMFRAHGKWFIASQFVGLVTDRIQPWLIKIFISTEAVAIYSIADTMIGIIRKLFPTNTLASIIPLKVKDKAMARRVLTYGTKYFVLLMVLVGGVSSILAPQVIHIFFPAYEVSIPYFYALLITLPLSALTTIPTIYVSSLRKQKFFFFSDIFKMTIRVPFLILFLSAFGLWGMVFDKLVMTLIMSAVFLIYISRMKDDIPIAWRCFTSFNKEDIQFLRAILGEMRHVWKGKLTYFFASRS